MRRLRSACACLLAAWGATALAQAGADCVPGGTPEQVNACALRDFQAADAAVGVLYGDVMRALSDVERPQLRREHSAWLQQRTVACKLATRAFEQQADGPRRYHECLTEKTQERRQGLMAWLRG
ncbi:lysozyme inhibitor LprI family protein [Pseudorhodoferax sp.]|uniref:lysozyme inhibitor LprI family protein n=1 Tax=Pseudorhodoferax sp. TaxID=1993553 RepID=UPI002DD61B04|nr:lysozyme inhibitor LprI family protein [Pseudorhodoferax sp.]